MGKQEANCRTRKAWSHKAASPATPPSAVKPPLARRRTQPFEPIRLHGAGWSFRKHPAPTADDRKRGRMCSRRARNRAREFRDQAFCTTKARERRGSALQTAHSTVFSVISDSARRWLVFGESPLSESGKTRKTGSRRSPFMLVNGAP